MENSLTREETLKGMTLWAAYSNFQEAERGSISVGKMADFVLYQQDMMEVPLIEVPNTQVYRTYVGGELVHE